MRKLHVVSRVHICMITSADYRVANGLLVGVSCSYEAGRGQRRFSVQH